MKSSSGILLALVGAVLLMFGLSGKYRAILSGAFPSLVGGSSGASSGNSSGSGSYGAGSGGQPGDPSGTFPVGEGPQEPGLPNVNHPVRGSGPANNPANYLCPDANGQLHPCAGAGNNGLPMTGVFIPGLGGGGSFQP